MNTTENSGTQSVDQAGASSRSAQVMPMDCDDCDRYEVDWQPVPLRDIAASLLIGVAGVLAVPAVSFFAGWLMRGPSCG